MATATALHSAYPELHSIVLNATPASLEQDAVPYLIENWLSEYCRTTAGADIVETTPGACSFLFDIANARLIAAWTISRGAHAGKRDSNRMRGHPLAFGSRYHRGHAIPHSAGGPTDINLVPQLGALNVGAFRVLEKAAVACKGSLYFTHWLYADESQKPASVEQGLLRGGCVPSIAFHNN
jgi:hypothetical protein